MEKRIVTAVKQRFSIRKLSIGATSVLLGTSLYFMGVSAPVVHADTIGEPAASSEKTDSSDPSDPVSVAKDSTKSDVDVNNAIDQYAEDVKTKLESDPRNNGNKVIIRPSDKQPVTVNTTKDRANQVNNIKQKIDQANQSWDAINTCQKSNNKQIKDGKDSDYFENQSLSVDDEKKSEINQITVDGKGTTLLKGQSKNIDGIDIIHTTHMTDKEREAMKVNSNNKVIVNFQPDQCSNKEITVTYDNLKNSYYLENINNETSRIKISRIDRTFSGIQVAENPKLFYGGWRGNKYDNYDPCNGPQLIIYNDPSDGFFYNNIQQISVKDTYYYDDKGTQKQISFDTKDPAWVFVTSLNSNGGGNIEKVRALGSDDSPVNGEKIAGSTVTDHNDGWYYSDNNNNFSNANNIFGQKLDWDNNDEYNRFGFVGTAAFQYQPGMTLQYRSDDSQWGSHWACMQTQVVSSLNENVIICDHIKDKTERVTGNDTVTRTIHYLYDNGKTAKPDKTQTVSFNVTGIKNDVTGKTTWDGDAQAVDPVTTPSITGYTPDKLSIEGQDFKFGDKDVEVTVTYTANTQTAKITYIDDTTKTKLDSKDASGKFGQAITFETVPTDEIANYEKQGYVFVSSTFDNQKYQADNSNNVFYVHLKHDTKDVSRDCKVNMTVHYVMDDNSEAPSDNKQTLNFTENGIQDLVTQHIDWTPADSQTFKDVATPTMTGYTPDKANVTDQTVKFGDQDINVTVKYIANIQNAKITYIDDTTKTNLKSKAARGKFGQAITFETTPTVEIENYKKQGYVLVSNSFDNNKYQADDSHNVFYVHLKHGTKDVSHSGDVKMTVHYVMDDNSEAPSDNKQAVSFTENGIQDLVTKHIDWTPAVSQTLKDVDSPVLTGYTTDIKTANGKVVNFGDDDVEVTVHYSANTQTATITYIDDTEKKTLGSDNQNGKFNQTITFEHDPAEVIKGLEEKGYVFVSNTFDNQKYQADNKFNSFEVHLKHGTKNVSRSDDVNMTVHYVMDDNSATPSDNKQTLSFTEDGIQDLVTKHIDWTPAVSQTFKDVATKSIVGYTPDQDKVTGPIVNFGDNDVKVTVTYLPDVQLGHINYIDDDTKKTLTRDDFSGRTNEHEDYTSTDRIQEFENKGYVFVSSDYPDGGFNFDDNDQQDQVFNVHLKHGTVIVTTKKSQMPNTPINPDPQSPKYPKDISNTNSDVKRTIDYNFKDGKTAQPTVKDSLHFERTVVIDKVTGDVLSDTWTPSQNFNDIQTPIVQGYTPDRTLVSNKNIGHDHQDIIEHVVYSPDVQHMTITYIDDTTCETLHTDNPTGVSDQDAKYTTSDTVKKYEDQHYKLVSDSTKGQDLIFDHDDNVNQTYEVHFVHGEHAINQTTSPKQTIHYVYADGLARQGKAVDDNVQQVSFTRDGYNDEVTGIDHWNAWTPANSQYEVVNSPVIQGYTPDKLVVEKSTVNRTDQDIEVTVTYSADKQAAHVIYVDKATNTTLASKDLSGKSDEDSEYNTGDKIGQYKSQHYVLFEDETNGKNVVFDHDDQQDQTYYVYFVHDTQKVNRQDTVTSTIDYKFEDGKTAQPTVTQTKYFSENGIKDLVTNKITWDEAAPQKFEDVATKPIVGYTPDKENVVGRTVKFGDQDIKVTITYHNNVQSAKITYIDDMTNNTLASDSQDGKFDHEIKFNNNPSDVISGFEKSGYKLVSSNFKDGTKYKADNKQNEFIVHLTHDMQSVSRQDKVTETIHYVYEDSSKSQPDHEQTLSFNETGTKDLVTGKITWDEAKPQKFEDVVTPKMTGYTPDTDNVVGSTVKFGDDDVEVTVKYIANAQTATITYIDDTEKKTLNSDKQNGKFNQVITFEHDPAEVIKGLEEKGYKLVSDNFKPGIKYQSDNKSNSFEIHLVHTYEPVETSQTITETVYYIDANGKPVAPDHVATVVVKVTGTRDKVTNTTTWNTSSTGHFDEVLSPVVPNMTPDKTFIPGRDVRYGDSDITENVVYTPDEMPGGSEKPNKSGNPTSKTPEKPNKSGNPTTKTPGNPNKPGDSTPKTPEKSNKPGNSTTKTPKKPHKSGNPTATAPKNKQFGTTVKTTITEKPIDNRTVDNHASAKSTAKRELPQTGATTNIGIWIGLASMIVSLSLLGASKKRKKN